MSGLFSYLKQRTTEYINYRPDDKAVHLPFLRMILGPVSLWVDYLKNFLWLGGLVSAVLSIMYLSAGMGYMCIYEAARTAGENCVDFSASYFILFSCAKLLILTYFAVKFYNVCYNNAPLNWCYVFSIGKVYFHSLGMVVLFLLLNTIPFVSLYLLYIRVPNPDWRIEVLYFAVVSIGFLVPFVLIKFYSLLAFTFSGTSLPSIRGLWVKNSGNMMTLILSLGLIFIIGFFSFLSFFNNFKLVAGTNPVYISITAEFLYNLLVLMFVALFVNHCYLQRKYLFEGNQNEQ